MDVLIIVMSLVAGVVGTGLGGVIGVIFAGREGRLTGKILGYAGGVMLGVVALDMFPDGVVSLAPLGRYCAFAAFGTLLLGVLAVFLIGKLVSLVTRGSPVTLTQAVSLLALPKQKNAFLLKTGAVMLFAIALHNLPEGMAIGASGANAQAAGVLVAIIIAVHNVPEGMAIGAPLAGGGARPALAILLASLAGGATVLGAVIGLLVGGLGEIATGVCLLLSSGAMLYVTFAEMLPQAAYANGKLPPLSPLLGFLTATLFLLFFNF